ncbi:MAG: hypothetical protein J6I96_02755 [Oscillospiraceae bacterium]|nr:hypothetical protein [Oscillospiraceae bacterium]
MTREEVLSRSRKENSGADLVSLRIAGVSRGLAGAGVMIIGAVLNLIASIRYDARSPVFWAMFFGYSAIQGISAFILMKKNGINGRSWLWLAYGAFMGIMTVMAVAEFFRYYEAAV